MPRRAVDDKKLGAKPVNRSVLLDPTLIPFIISMADDDTLSSGLRAIVRIVFKERCLSGKLAPSVLRELEISRPDVYAYYVSTHPATPQPGGIDTHDFGLPLLPGEKPLC